MSKPVVLILNQDGLLKEKLEESIATVGQPLFVNHWAEIHDLVKERNVLCVLVDANFKGKAHRTKIVNFRGKFETIPIVLFGKITKGSFHESMSDHCIFIDSLDELLQQLPTIIGRRAFEPEVKVFGIVPEQCSPRIKKALRMMIQEFRETLTMEALADRLGVHRSHFEREWHHNCGTITAKQLLIGLRLHHSIYLMQNDGLKLKDIARRTGFANEHMFYRSFHRHLGMTASSYRRNHAFAEFELCYWSWQRTR